MRAVWKWLAGMAAWVGEMHPFPALETLLALRVSKRRQWHPLTPMQALVPLLSLNICAIFCHELTGSLIGIRWLGWGGVQCYLYGLKVFPKSLLMPMPMLIGERGGERQKEGQSLFANSIEIAFEIISAFSIIIHIVACVYMYCMHVLYVYICMYMGLC